MHPDVHAVQADLGDPDGLAEASGERTFDLVAITAWTRMDTEAENIRVDGGAVRDLLAALSPGGAVRHVALMSGLEHHLGPFEAYGTGEVPDTPVREEEKRLPYPNFYDAQEDELFAAAERDESTWSVPRSHTVFGHATGNAMNMVGTLCARVASWWHTDADLGRDIEVTTDMNKSRTAGSTSTRDIRASFFDHAQRYRDAPVIP